MVGSVNALLLVQMFHFLVGYLILKHLFLRPGLAMVTAIDEIDQGLRRDLALMQEEVGRQEGIANDQWERHCRVLCSRMPLERPQLIHMRKRTFAPVERLSTEESQQLTQQVKQVIVGRIGQES